MHVNSPNSLKASLKVFPRESIRPLLARLLVTSIGFGASLGWAAEAQLPEAASAVQELTGPSKTSLDARNWRLDPAVFTEITPFTAPDIAIELPLDQREEDIVPLPNPNPASVQPKQQ